MHLQTALICAALGLVGGSFVPSMIAALPEPEPDPEEKEGDFPDKVLYSDLAERDGLGWKTSLACAFASAALGGAIGWHWHLLWLFILVPIGCALAIIDYVTWYLPRQLVNPGYLLVAVAEVLAALRLHNGHILVYAVVGFVALGGYYGLMYLISPRMMAYGDVRLGGLLGLALGPFGIATVIISVFAAAVVGVIAWMPLKLLGNTIKRDPNKSVLSETLPFGPFLLVGAWLALLLDLWITALVAS